MKLLLDTCTFLWIIQDSPRLSKKARDLFLDKRNEARLSVVSVWEMVLKYQLLRLPLPEPPDTFIPKQCYLHDIGMMPLEDRAIYELLKIPPLHNDPFDRMLVCQARAHDLVILTPDKLVTDYQVQSVW